MFSTSWRKETYSTLQLYNVAVIARTKLSTAACEAEHNLRLLVGHANLLDDLTEALLKCKIEPNESKDGKWSDTLLDLDEDSDESSCGDELETEDLYDQASSDLERNDLRLRHQNNHQQTNTMIIRPSPRTPAPLLQIVDAMPKLERMKHCPTLESIDEEDVVCSVQETLQAMKAIPVALQAMQALTISAEEDSPINKNFGSAAPTIKSRMDLIDAPLAASVAAVGAG